MTAGGPAASCVAVVLAGGESRRFGSDKLSAMVAGQALLERTIGGLPSDWSVLVVGPERRLTRAVRFVREEPPGGGPTAGLVAGLRAALAGDAEQIVVLPGDAPAAGQAAVQMRRALLADPSITAIVGVDVTGFEQPLQLALRRDAAADLVRHAGPSGGHGGRARTLVGRLDPPARRRLLSAEDHFDIDTAEQLATWTALHGRAVGLILAAVDGLEVGDRPVVVALDGPSGVGKSTMAAALALARPVTVVEGDDFYSPRVASLGRLQRDRLVDAEVVDLVFDWRRLREEALVPLRRGATARFARYDWDADDGRPGAERELVPAELVVVDGVYSARPELADLVDVAVCLQVDEGVRQTRLATRTEDLAGVVSFWERGERYYFAEVRPPATYDLVVSWVED